MFDPAAAVLHCRTEPANENRPAEQPMTEHGCKKSQCKKTQNMCVKSLFFFQNSVINVQVNKSGLFDIGARTELLKTGFLCALTHL